MRPNALAMAVLLVGCLLPPPGVPQPGSPSSAEPASSTIFVARREWHIDIGFATAELEAPLDSLAEQFPRAQYLFFGFGDRHYLMAKQQNLPAMLGALLPGPGIILVTALENSPRQAFGAAGVIELRVPREQARAAQAYIWSSLAPTEETNGEPRVTAYARGPYEDSSYFSTPARYSAFHTCNTWGAEVLQAASLPVRSKATLFAWQLWGQIRKLAGGQPGALPADRSGLQRPLGPQPQGG